jgi:hypothetical protein
MNKLYLLLGWYVAISIGASQLIIDNVFTPSHIIGYVLLMGIPTGVYLYFRYRTPKKETTKTTI